MGKCVRCGLEGAFVRVDEQGYCVLCRQMMARANQKKPSVIRASDLDPHAVITRYLTTAHDTYPKGYNVVEYYRAEFECMLASLPRADCCRQRCDAPAEEPQSVILRKFNGCTLEDCADFVAFDTETSGLGGGAEIIEISAVKFLNFRPVAAFETLCRPYRPISPQATAVNGISNAMVKDAPRFAEVIPSLQAFMDGLPLVAHNAVFDVRMLASDGFPTRGRQVFDTLSLARTLLRDSKGNKLPSYRLADACRACAILFSGSHRSTADAMAAGLLFLELVKRQFAAVDLLHPPSERKS